MELVSFVSSELASRGCKCNCGCFCICVLHINTSGNGINGSVNDRDRLYYTDVS